VAREGASPAEPAKKESACAGFSLLRVGMQNAVCGTDRPNPGLKGELSGLGGCFEAPHEFGNRRRHMTLCGAFLRALFVTFLQGRPLEPRCARPTSG